MERAIDMLHLAFLEIQDGPSLVVDLNYIMHIFEPTYKDLPEFEKNMDSLKEEGVGNSIGLHYQAN